MPSNNTKQISYSNDTQVREIVRDELRQLFDLDKLLSTPAGDTLDNMVLSYISAIAKEYKYRVTTEAIKNLVDETLANTFDIYRRVHPLEEHHMGTLIREFLDEPEVKSQIRVGVRTLIREYFKDYIAQNASYANSDVQERVNRLPY